MKTFKIIMFALLAAFTLSFATPQQASAFTPMGQVSVGEWTAYWCNLDGVLEIRLLNMSTHEELTYLYVGDKSPWPDDFWRGVASKGKVKVYLGDKEVKAGGGGVSYTIDEILDIVLSEIYSDRFSDIEKMDEFAQPYTGSSIAIGKRMRW